MSKPKFKIIGKSHELKALNFELIQILYPQYHLPLDEGIIEALVLPTAQIELFEHIGWGCETAENQVEQGGLIVGRLFTDKDRWVVVVHKFLAGLTEGSMKHLRFSHNAWENLFEQFDLIDSELQLRILGWYHTHPKHLRVYMSEIDRNTQSSFFKEDWQISIIANPQQQIIKSFFGKNCIEVKLKFIL